MISTAPTGALPEQPRSHAKRRSEGAVISAARKKSAMARTAQVHGVDRGGCAERLCRSAAKSEMDGPNGRCAVPALTLRRPGEGVTIYRRLICVSPKKVWASVPSSQ